MRSGIVRHSVLFWLGACVMAAGVLTGVPAGAVNTEVMTQVCGSTVGPVGSSITVTEPETDTVVKESELEISGTVARATQITVLIDNSYVHTVPLGANQASYSTTLSLTEGTHTIELIANDVCGEQNDSKTIVITYTIPVTTPDQPDTGGDAGVVVGDDATGSPVQRTPFETLSQMPVLGPILGFGSWAIYTLGLDYGLNDAVSGLLNLWRVLLFTTGLLVLAFTQLSLYRGGSSLIAMIEKTVVGRDLAHRHKLWVLRIFAVLCVILALIL